MNELSRLSQGFGIGVIHLNLEELFESRVLHPARPREDLDWITLDKLVAMNAAGKVHGCRASTTMNRGESSGAVTAWKSGN